MNCTEENKGESLNLFGDRVERGDSMSRYSREGSVLMFVLYLYEVVVLLRIHRLAIQRRI